jgi:hypothetical protein
MVQEERKQRVGYNGAWRQIMIFILIGLFLCSFNINLSILPILTGIAGRGCIFLGFYFIRKENEYFEWAWILSILFLGMFLITQACSAVPAIVEDSFWRTGISIVHLAILAGMMLLLQAGLHECGKTGIWPVWGLLLYEMVFMLILFLRIEMDPFWRFIFVCVHTWLLIAMYLNIVKKQ